MKQDIRLYLAGQRADLGEDARILFNYKVTETQNPTVVKNNFSKSIVLEGTDNNNALFGEIYDLSRLQTYGTGNYAGVDFNPLKKADFALYIDSELYETGYFKLTEISKTNTRVAYSITLFGGLGEFLFNLEESAAGNKLEFRDITLIRSKETGQPVGDLTFPVDMSVVDEAWRNIDNPSSRYSTMNFMPCYNGLPSSFDCSNVLINLYGKPDTMGNVTGITSYNGWARGTCSRDMTEWETRDLRASLQRPCLRVRHLIESACYPDNNGGYEVNLDKGFFNDSNPYWDKAWVALSQVKDIMGIDGSEESEPVSGATITGATIAPSDDYQAWYFDVLAPDVDFAAYSNMSMDLEVNFVCSAGSSTNASVLYTSIDQEADTNFTLSSRYVKRYTYHSAILLQLVAFDEIGKVVASSAAYQLMSKVQGNKQPDFRENLDGSVVNIPEWKTLYGYFKRLPNGSYTWCDMNGNPQMINFRFPSNTTFCSLKLRLQRPVFYEIRNTGLRVGTTWHSTGGGGYFWPTNYRKVNGNHESSYFISYGTLMQQNPIIHDFTATATRYGGFITGKEITQNRILTLGVTPGQFLLSYCKLFGLHIWKDPIKKLIYIADRGEYYDTDWVEDIGELLDRGKEMKITPQVAQSRWYDFHTEQNASEANDQYLAEYGNEFGLARVNTSFDFDASNTVVYDGAFKGAVQVLESSPYYYDDFYAWPVYCYNGFTLTTFHAGAEGLDGTDHTVNTQTGANIYPLNGDYEGFDIMDKPQFHTADNTAEEGAMSLFFYTGKIPTNGKYHITNDIGEMVMLNEKKPCWILTSEEYDTAGNRIGIEVQELPHFSRYLSFSNNGYITHSWDFGRTLETYIPGTVLAQGCSIYEGFWKKYISDMYDVNSRVLSCRCLLKGQVNPDWLRHFYYFDNALWRLNTIKEWNPGSYDTTACEFLKVNDLENYLIVSPTANPDISFYLPDYTPTSTSKTQYTESRYYTVGGMVPNVTVDVEANDGSEWHFGESDDPVYSISYDNGLYNYSSYSTLVEGGVLSGVGSTRLVFNIGNNSGRGANPRTFRFNILVHGSAGDFTCFIYLRQEIGEVYAELRVSRFAGTGNLAAENAKAYLDVYSSSDWTAVPVQPYVHIDKTRGPSGRTTTVQVSVDDNPSTTDMRECTVVFNNVGGMEREFSVMQNPLNLITDLSFSAATYIFETPEAADIAAQVECPTAITSWSITVPDWITATPSTGGTGVTQVTLHASANPLYETRWGELYLIGGGTTDTANFGQWGLPPEGITLELDRYQFNAESGETRAKVVSSVNGWHLEYPSWVAPSLSGGNSGRTYIDCTVAANGTGRGRVGTLRVSGGNYSAQASITQDA